MINKIVILSVAAAMLGGCASSQMKARKEQRDKAAQTSKLYCDFINGELYPDVEVMLNLEMAKRCDSEKPFSLTNYKTSNENMGIVFCCALPEKDLKPVKSESPPATPKKEVSGAVSAAAPAGAKPGDKSAAAASPAKSGDDELGN